LLVGYSRVGFGGVTLLSLTEVIFIMTYVMTGLSQKTTFAPNLSLLPVRHTSY
jgi:hypothetical protein